jgi:hypothetical protein
MNDLIDGLEEKTSSDVMDLYPTTVAYFRCGMFQLSRCKADFQKVLP